MLKITKKKSIYTLRIIEKPLLAFGLLSQAKEYAQKNGNPMEESVNTSLPL